MTSPLESNASAERVRRRRPRLRRVPHANVALTPSHRRILALLSEYRYLTAPLLAQAYAPSGRGAKHVQNELGRLYHNGYVSRHRSGAALPGEGGEAFIYCLAPDGARAVLSPDEWRASRHFIYARGQEKTNVAHSVSVSALQLLLAHGTGGTLEEFVSDHEDQSRQLRAEVPGLGWRTVWPDAEAIMRHADGRRVLCLVEIDRTRRANRRADERCRAYAALVSGRSGARLKVERGADVVEVLFAEPSEGEQKRLAIRAHALCHARTISAVPPFRFWSMARWWDGPRLRSASDVLAEPQLLTLSGTWTPFYET